MILRKLTPADSAQAEALWHEIFAEDTRAFNTYYFDNRFYPAHSFGAFDGDRLAAMALGRPTEIAAEGRILPALLVAGVSTRPPYRGQGLMHRLMTLLIDHARSGGFVCCYLHPVSETLYASLGFRNGTDALVIRSDAARAHGRSPSGPPFLIFCANSISSSIDISGARPISTRYLSRASLERFVMLFVIFNCLILFYLNV